MPLTVHDVIGIKDIKLTGVEFGAKVYSAYDELKQCPIVMKEKANGTLAILYGDEEFILD